MDTVRNIYLSSARTFPTGLRCTSLLKVQQLPYELQHELGQVLVPLRSALCQLQNVSVVHADLYEIEEDLSGPLQGLPGKGVVGNHLVETIHT